MSIQPTILMCPRCTCCSISQRGCSGDCDAEGKHPCDFCLKPIWPGAGTPEDRGRGYCHPECLAGFVARLAES